MFHRWLTALGSSARRSTSRATTSGTDEVPAPPALCVVRGTDAPRAHERLARLQDDQGIASPERVRRAGHGLDAEASPVDVGKRVTCKQHQVWVALVDPERETAPADGIPEPDASEAVLIPFEVGEGVVEFGRGN